MKRKIGTMILAALMLLTSLQVGAQGVQKHSDGLDNVMQYVPYASVLALKGFGVDSKDNWRDLTLTTAASWVMTAGMTYGLKHAIKEWRPDGTDRKSFPSGHSAIAFAGATMLRHEFQHVSPWIPVAGYGLATFVAIDRVARDRHHWYDVAAGAAVGAGMSELTWWLSRKVLKRSDVAIGFSDGQVNVRWQMSDGKKKRSYGDGMRSKPRSSEEQHAQTEQDDNKVRPTTHSFWSDWFVQLGLDMTLQNPYGYNFANVFPNGKSFGVDVAVGKWFTPEVGVRGKLNWENGIGLFRNDHANWLAPFDRPGVNMDKGGYIGLYGDLLVNLSNCWTGYKADRTWNVSAYPRVGVNYNFGVTKGSLLIGAGLLTSYRLSHRWSVYLDAAYIMSGSGFVGKTKEIGGTGTGSNSNGYFSLGVGAQMALGTPHEGKNTVKTNGFFHNWWFQAGLDMSLLNPYGCNFSKVIPKGTTFGLNAAAGKWFTPEFGVRGRVQWDNGLIENKSLEWVPPVDNPRKNYKKGGFATAALDAMLNLTNTIGGYREDKKWHTSAFVRAGVITHFEEGSGSPLMGAGLEQTYRLNHRLSLFGSVAYQVSTSEGMGVSTTGMDVATGSNGFFNIDMGVKIDLGRQGWKR